MKGILLKYDSAHRGGLQSAVQLQYHSVCLNLFRAEIKARRRAVLHIFYDPFGENAEHTVLGTAHADICHIRRALRQYLLICRRHVCMRAVNARRSAIQIKAERSFFTGAFRMKINDTDIIFSGRGEDPIGTKKFSCRKRKSA